LQPFDAVLAPDFFVTEVTNVAWKLHRFGGMPLSEANTVLEDSLYLPDRLEPTRPYCSEAFRLATLERHPAYDLFYLLLAREHAATLFTKDKALARLAHKYKIATA
jgi:predicted nucleic acid-binding protein